MASKHDPKTGSADVASAEEMAEMAYLLLKDLHYSTTQHEFNERLFLVPNNEAFVSVYQFLLPLLDRREYRERFKFVLKVDDKRKEAEFRKALCTYLQDLAKAGVLGWDVPPIKMALFTTPGRSTFLHVLLCVIEAVLRRNASTLGLQIAPTSESVETLRTATNFYETQLTANRQLISDCRTKMRAQIDALLGELTQSEAAVERCRDELHRAQQQEQVLDSDQQNLERFSASVSRMMEMSTRLARLLHLVMVGDQGVDAHRIVKIPSQGLLALYPELQPMAIELVKQMTSPGQVDLVQYIRLLNAMLETFKPIFDHVLAKLTTGAAIQDLVEQQRDLLKRAYTLLSRVDDIVQEKEADLLKRIKPDRLANDLDRVDNSEALMFDLSPLTADDLIHFHQVMNVPNLQRDGCASAGAESSEVDATASLMNPPKGTLRRRKLNMANLRSKDNIASCSDLSGIAPLEQFQSTPRVALLKREDIGQRRRRSIKEFMCISDCPLDASLSDSRALMSERPHLPQSH